MSKASDIAVVGAGAAGIAAAVTAARGGCRTLLIDQRESAGGTGGFSGLTTLCGLYDDAGNMLNDGFAREFADAVGEGRPVRTGKLWVLRYRPERFRDVATQLLNSLPNLVVRWNTPVRDVALVGGRITGLNGIAVGAVIDCSGTAEVARTVGAECLATDDSTQAPAVVFPLHDIARELDSVVAATQVLLPLARAGLPPVSFQPHPELHSVTVKLTGSPEHAPQVIEFLRKNVAGFEHCRTSCTEFRLRRRAGRMIVGQYVLTGDDVLSARKFPDAVARGAWPIEQWNAAGVSRVRYLPAGEHYEIPARCLRAASIPNLFMAGKTISADVDAIASARVMGCCLATGAAAGNLAVAFVTSAQQQQQ
ncbi:MAG: FAD-dependent oxidoreductase [Verrucomicrobia bacterium]|nr:FAD-dependent oxidoreductase [Verrucomicrobiota bacterium]